MPICASAHRNWACTKPETAMVDRYLEYLATVRRYSPRTVEIYRGILEECLAFVSSGDAPYSKVSARQDFALRAHPSQPDGWAPPVHETTGGHGFPGVTASGRMERTIAVLIGPEGDFSPEEAALAREHGWIPVQLGPSRLRTETAALTAVTAVYLFSL